MRSPTVLAVLFAGLALASPIVKKNQITDIVTVVDYVYVTDVEPAPLPTSTVFYGHHSRHHRSSAIDQAAQPPASSTTSSAPPPPASITPSQVPVRVVVPQSSSTAPPVAEYVAPVQASSAAPSPTDVASSCTYHHNIHRQNHSAVDVTWDADLASDAQVLANTCNFHHDTTIGKGKYGQNIYEYMVSSGGSSLSEAEILIMAISDWYNSEYQCYAPYFGKSPDMSSFETWGHLTQILWNGSTTIGCAATYCPNMNPGWESWYAVCNYGPAGNMGNEYAANVFPALGKPVVNG